MSIMSTNDWLRETHGGRLSIRSSALKKIDVALKQYHLAPSEDSIKALRLAVIGWMGTKGKWQLSTRNRHGTVTRLVQAIGLQPDMRPPLDAESLFLMKRGIDIVEAETSEIVAKLFQGARLEWKASIAKSEIVFDQQYIRRTEATMLQTAQQRFRANAKAEAKENGRLVVGIHANVSTLTDGPVSSGRSGTSSQTAKWLFDKLTPECIRDQVASGVAELIPDFMSQLAKSVTPFLGLMLTGGGAIASSCKAIRGEYRVHKAKMRTERIMTAREPAEAMAALIRILKRERNANTVDASVGLAEFGGKLTGLLLDGGVATNAAVGLSAGVIRLANVIRLVTRDVQERNEANKLMQMGVDINIFKECPLVGCYLICCAPTSVLINLMAVNWGDPGMMYDIERVVVRDLEPTQEQARRIIHDSRFVIPSLINFPNVISRKDVHKKLNEMETNKRRYAREGTTLPGFGSDSSSQA